MFVKKKRVFNLFLQRFSTSVLTHEYFEDLPLPIRTRSLASRARHIILRLFVLLIGFSRQLSQLIDRTFGLLVALRHDVPSRAGSSVPRLGALLDDAVFDDAHFYGCFGYVLC